MIRRTPLILRAVVLAALVLGLLAVSTVPASAEPAPQLEGPVTDRTGALDGGAGDVEAAIERTLEDHGVQAWVLFVDSTDGQPAPDYATEAARINSLGGWMRSATPRSTRSLPTTSSHGCVMATSPEPRSRRSKGSERRTRALRSRRPPNRRPPNRPRAKAGPTEAGRSASCCPCCSSG